MPEPYILVSFHLCPYVQRAVITLLEKRIPHERVYIDLADKPDWFTAISPLGKVPLLRVGGEVLFESAVLCEYLDEVTPGSLHPADPLAKARHRAWIEFASATLDAVAGFYAAKDEGAFELKRAVLQQRLSWLERHLGEGPFFSGETFALVDAAYAPVFRYFDAFERIGDFGFLTDTPKLRAYRAALADRPSVREAVAADYPERLMRFLKARGSHLSTLIPDAADQPAAA